MGKQRRDATALGGALIAVGGTLVAAFATVQSSKSLSVWHSGWFDFGMGTLVLGLLIVAWGWLRPIRRVGQSPIPTAAAPTSAVPSTEAASRVAEPPAPRLFVERTPEQLTGEFERGRVTSMQGEARVARYLGRWIRVSGPLGDVYRIGNDRHACFSNRSLFDYNVVRMRFRDPPSIERLDVQCRRSDDGHWPGHARRCAERRARLLRTRSRRFSVGPLAGLNTAGLVIVLRMCPRLHQRP